MPRRPGRRTGSNGRPGEMQYSEYSEAGCSAFTISRTAAERIGDPRVSGATPRRTGAIRKSSGEPCTHVHDSFAHQRYLCSAVPGILKTLFPLLAALVCGGPPSPAAAEELPPQQVQVSRSDTLESTGRAEQVSLSSRFVIPASLRIFCDNAPLSPELYRLDPVRGLVYLDSSIDCSRLVASYLAWPFTFQDSFRLRAAFADSAPAAQPTADTAEAAVWDSLPRRKTAFGSGAPAEGFRLAGFEIRGSKSVSVSGGGLAGGGTLIDQNLMIEINGKLSPETRLSLRLNDQDLPLVPEGRSAELRQLDEISVTLSSPRGRVSLGDYDFRLEGYRFAGLERKLDGVEGRYNGKNFKLGASAALSGGTFHQLRFNGLEGRQGPYALTGKNGEPVNVLAGTERVYLDGRLMRRGVRQDYTVDYLQGTLTFTERHLIGAESRIEVDYEYISQTFKKSLYSVTGKAEGSPGWVRGYFLRESDLENSPLGEDFTAGELEYLAGQGLAGDSLVFSGVRYLGEGRGLYVLRAAESAYPWFEYVGPGRGDYMVTFREVGEFRGAYSFDPTSGGYRYLGRGLGDFDPIGEFSPPVREDRSGLAFELTPVSHLRFTGEGALLKRTVNLYSGRGRPLRTAHELFAGLDTLGLPGLPGRISLRGRLSEVQSEFSFQGRRYEADFERRWHLDPAPSGSAAADHGERVQETGGRVELDGGISLNADYGRLARTNGERANRRRYILALEPCAALNARWQHLNIHSLRLFGDSSAPGGPAESYRRRHNAEVSGHWGLLTPRFTLEREERTEPSRYQDREGTRYLELSQALTARFSPRLETGFLLTRRSTDYLRPPPAAGRDRLWDHYSRALSGQVNLRYQGKSSFRLSGRLGHRRRTYEGENIGRTSMTAGRLDLSSGNFAGALQSHLLYEISHGSSMRRLVRYLPERYPDEGEYLEDGTYVGKAQGTHRRELAPAQIDPRQAAKLRLTSRENLDLTSWVDSAGKVIKRITLGSTVLLERENTLRDKWKLYLLFPSALNDRAEALMRSTRINTDITVHWADPEIYSRLELLWTTRFDRRFERGFEENGERTLRFQLRVPLSGAVEWDPTAAVGKTFRHDLAGHSGSVKKMSLTNSLIANFGSSWRASFTFDAARLQLQRPASRYLKLGSGAGLTRFLAGSGRLEAAFRINQVSGSEREDVRLVEVLGLARSGTSYETTVAASVETAERMLLHVRYTGRTDYFLGRFTHYARAEMKYFF